VRGGVGGEVDDAPRETIFTGAVPIGIVFIGGWPGVIVLTCTAGALGDVGETIFTGVGGDGAPAGGIPTGVPRIVPSFTCAGGAGARSACVVRGGGESAGISSSSSGSMFVSVSGSDGTSPDPALPSRSSSEDRVIPCYW
jgi:hypothetical protein